MVDPRVHGESPVAQLVDREGRRPQIVGQGFEGERRPALVALVPKHQSRRNVIVPIAKDGGGHLYFVAAKPARGISPAVDLRLNVFDDDALAAFNWFHANPIL